MKKVLDEREKLLDSYEETQKKINEDKEAELMKKIENEEKKFINFIDRMSSDEKREEYRNELKEHMKDKENYEEKLKSLDARELAVKIKEKKLILN